jgi:glycosyltransferase involved in cell wall biosynthesis
MSVITDILMSSPLAEQFELSHVDTSDRRSLANVGRFDVRNVGLGLWHAASFVFTLVRRRPHLCHIPVARTRIPFLRDALFLLPARLARCEVVVHLHASGFRQFAASQPAWMRRVIKLCIPRHAHAIVLAERLRAEFDGLVDVDRVHVVPNGVADPGAGQDHEPIVLHLSTLWAAKGVFSVLRAAPRVHANIPTAKFVFAGEWFLEDERRRAAAYVAEHHLGDVVLFLGPVTGPQKAELLQMGAVMAVPSPDEGHPLVVLEALAAGMPVIAAPVGALPETIEDGREGYLVQPERSDELAERICRLLADESLRSRMGRAARARYEEAFTAERFTADIGRVWQTALTARESKPEISGRRSAEAVRP